MRKFLLLIVLTLSLSTSLLSQAYLGFSVLGEEKSTTIKFRNESNLIVLPVMVNGQGPYNFILDTGSKSGVIFDKNILDSTRLESARKVPIYDENEEKITDLLVVNQIEVAFGEVTGTNQSMLVFQENNLDIKNTLGVEATGVLGSEVFNRFVVEVNYIDKSITLHEPEAFKRPSGYFQLDIDVKDLRPFTSIKIKQKKMEPVSVNVLIDTGTSSALFLDEENNEEIILPETVIDHTVGRGLKGNIKGKVGRTKKVRIGKYRFKNVVTSFPEDWQVQKEIEGPNISLQRGGTIGSDVLSRFSVIYHYLDEVIYLRPNNKYANPFKFNTLGLRVFAMGEDLKDFYVSEVIIGSPSAKAGVQVGDQIIAVNGKPISSFKFSEINSIIRADPRTKTKLILNRKGVLVEITVKHQRLI